MKILIATESFWPNLSGVAIFGYNLALAMAKRKHKVYVVAPGTKFYNYIEKHEGITIYRLRSAPNVFRQGFRTSFAPKNSIKRLLVNLKPNIIHVQDPAAVGLATIGLAKKMGMKTVVTNHFTLDFILSYLGPLKYFHDFFEKFFYSYFIWLYNKATVITCPSETVANLLKKQNLKTPIKVISNGIDLDRFIPSKEDKNVRQKYAIPLEKTVLLNVGRLDVDKQVHVAIKAMPKVLEEHDVILVIVGHGTELLKLKKLVGDLKIEDKVIFTGPIPYISHDLPKLYHTATLFLLSSPIETQSLVVLEAMATGLPIITTPGALSELIRHGINGILFKTGDAKAMAREISLLLKKPEKIAKMSKQNLADIQKHNIEHTFDKFEKLYTGIMKHKS